MMEEKNRTNFRLYDSVVEAFDEATGGSRRGQKTLAGNVAMMMFVLAPQRVRDEWMRAAREAEVLGSGTMVEAMRERLADLASTESDAGKARREAGAQLADEAIDEATDRQSRQQSRRRTGGDAA